MEKWLRTKFPGNCFSIHRCDKQGFSPVWSVYKCSDLGAFMNQDEYLRMVDMNKTYGYKCFQILNPIWNFLCQKIECFHQTLYSLEMAFSIPIEIYTMSNIYKKNCAFWLIYRTVCMLAKTYIYIGKNSRRLEKMRQAATTALR